MNPGDKSQSDSAFRIQSKLCSAKLSRGMAKTSTFSTSNLTMHLKNKRTFSSNCLLIGAGNYELDLDDPFTS